MEESTATQQPATIASSRELIEALTARKTRYYTLKVGDREIKLRLRAISWQEKHLYDRALALQADNRGNLAKPELMWIQFGVVDEYGARIFQNEREMEPLLQADSQSINDLIHAIKVLSGYAADIEWDRLYDDVLNASVDQVMALVDMAYKDLVGPDLAEAYTSTSRDFREALSSVMKTTFYHVGQIERNRANWDLDDSGITDEELGNT